MMAKVAGVSMLCMDMEKSSRISSGVMGVLFAIFSINEAIFGVASCNIGNISLDDLPFH